MLDSITLENFDTELDPTIVSRGQKYFLKNRVQDLSESDDHTYSAIVEGGDVYDVEVALEKGEVIDMDCDCPYFMGPVCKHQVAVLYAVKQSLGSNVRVIPKKPKPKKLKRQSIEDIIEGLSREELERLVFRFAE